MISRRQEVLDVLQEGVRTWNELRELTNINDENLGFTLGELLDERKIWTMPKGEGRIYGIERRRGLVPRLGHLQRRASDLQAL